MSKASRPTKAARTVTRIPFTGFFEAFRFGEYERVGSALFVLKARAQIRISAAGGIDAILPD